MEQLNEGNRMLTSLAANEARIRSIFNHCDDIVFRSFRLKDNGKGIIVFPEGLVDEQRIEAQILQPLLFFSDTDVEWDKDKLTWLIYKVLPTEKITIQISEDATAEAILSGDVLLLVDGVPSFILIGMSSFKTRSIEEPLSEPVIRGPRDGFTECLQINTTLIRRRLLTPKLKSELLHIGTLSRTKISVMYVEGIVKQNLIEEVRKRLQNIQIETVLESGYIEELILDNRYSLFPQMMTTERPDRATAALSEGKVVILVDNTPFCLIAPTSSFEMLQSAEDYSQNFIIMTATRWLRFSLSIIALTFPSIYIAVTTMHQEMLPSDLLLSIASAREAVPFPAIIEATIMELAFEGLREAGIRLPRQVGQAVSIVGALVIGQAAVQAGLVSSPLVIVVSFTGIASFVFPSYTQGMAIRFLRFPLMLVAGVLGLYGILVVFLAMLIHLSKLKSFGVPYLSPSASFTGIGDIILRAPWWSNKNKK